MLSRRDWAVGDAIISAPRPRSAPAQVRGAGTHHFIIAHPRETALSNYPCYLLRQWKLITAVQAWLAGVHSVRERTRTAEEPPSAAVTGENTHIGVRDDRPTTAESQKTREKEGVIKCIKEG